MCRDNENKQFIKKPNTENDAHLTNNYGVKTKNCTYQTGKNCKFNNSNCW